jgi:hypothetical protein
VQLGVGVAGPPVVGNAVLSDAQESDLLAGLWYLNLHTTTHAGGEIRGQVTVVPATVPAMGPIGFAVLAGLLMAAACWRLKSQPSLS